MDPTPGNKETGEGYDPRFAAPFLTPDVITTSFKNGKYPHSTNDDGKSNTYYFLRLGEVYYIHAEAEARQGGNHDMIRYYKHGDLDITTIRPNIKSDKQLILPIPQSAKAGNNLLIENP